MTREGRRVLALDVGERRVGVAISDPTAILARPLTTIVRASRKDDFEAIAALLEEHGVKRVIVGLPLSLDGTEGPQARRVKRYAERLSQSLDIPLEFWDERYSSAIATEFLKQGGRRHRRQRHGIDAVAAAVILQSFLDAQNMTSFSPENNISRPNLKNNPSRHNTSRS